MRAFLEEQRVTNVEFYPLEVTDHQGRVVAEPRFVAHLTDPVECIDAAASGVKWMGEGLETQRIFRMRSMVVDVAKVPEDRQLFFPRYCDKHALVRARLAAALIERRFTNLEVVPLSEHAR